MSQSPKRPAVLLQLDCDAHPSVFDSVVAIDSGVDRLLRFGHVQVLDVQGLVHGAMFTRGGEDLRRTAIFVGGSDVQKSEDIVAAIAGTFFGPVRVSVMADPNGSNTTAAAAVVRMTEHMETAGVPVGVFGATGPVGRRVVHLLGKLGARVFCVSRSSERARELCEGIAKRVSDANLVPVGMDETSDEEVFGLLKGCHGLIAAGAAGVNLVPEGYIEKFSRLEVAIDLNAVPPAGVAGIGASDNARPLGRAKLFGPLAIGGLKMKIHKRCIQSLFERNDLVLDIDEIFETGEALRRRQD